MTSTTVAQSAPIHDDVFAFDLCGLAYQLYNQSLIWPLDPFYEEWARPGASRRDNVMASVHDAVKNTPWLRGPGATRGWETNRDLDPILADYRRIDPTRPVLTNDGTTHRWLAAHDSITDRLSETVVCEYDQLRSGRPVNPHFSTRVAHSSAGSDTLYVFEGGTGSYDQLPHAWSMLGLVLDRSTNAGHEVHIAFRGSQSGNGNRAAFQGFVSETGNPDWVTDMEFLQTVSDHRISASGSVTVGLRDSVLSAMGTLVHCLEDIAERHDEPPTVLHISGHSLGGALAVQLAAALSVGSIRQALPESLRAWPLDSIRVTTFGAPKSGDAAFANEVASHIDGRRIWVHGDPIPEFPDNEHVGVPVRLENGRIGTINHEPTTTRRVLLGALEWQNENVDADLATFEPWRDFDDLGTALDHAAKAGIELSTLFPWRDDDEYDALLIDVVAGAVEKASSYRVPWTKPAPERARRRRRLGTVMNASAQSIGEIVAHIEKIRGVQPGSAEDYLRRWFIIREASRNAISIESLLDDERTAHALGTYRRAAAPALDSSSNVAAASGPDVAVATGPDVDGFDAFKIRALVAMRNVHYRTVVEGIESKYRRRVPPVSGMPKVVQACTQYPGLEWLPKELMVPEEIPAEGQLQLMYKAKYYGLAKVGFGGYSKSPIRKDVPWKPENPWRSAFAPPEDGWSNPTNDETFTRLRLQGPNPFDLRKDGDGFVLDFDDLFEGLLPRVAARFDLKSGSLVPRQIDIGPFTHYPGDPTWDRAKRVVNAADVRVVPFLRHLLEVHFLVGGSFALSAYCLPTWHRLRPFMHFFSYGTLQVNDYAYQAFFKSSSYFVASGFISGESASTLFQNRLANFSFDAWNPLNDIATRGLDEISDHPYVEDARRAWPLFTQMIERYMDALGFDDETIRNDDHLDIWYRTLGTLIPNFDARAKPLDRARLVELLASFLYNNVIHEVCGDLSPLLGSGDPDDKAITNLVDLANAVGDGRLDRPIPAPTMNDVFLMDQASAASQYHVGGNNLLGLTPERWIDEPRLVAAVKELQRSLAELDVELDARNDERAVRFGRMQPRYWEASISF